MIFATTDLKGSAFAASGLVIVPAGASPSAGWDVVAWDHHTTGVAAKCAPSHAANPFSGIPGLSALMERGYAVAAVDYPGLGADGPPSTFVGPLEAHATLDLIRAARDLPGEQIGPRFAVWGHSQGGHAALFTGQEAARYAPELTLVGVGAVAPATNLASLFHYVEHSLAGNVVIAYGVWSWTRAYGLSADSVSSRAAAPIVERVANDCVETDAELVRTAYDARALSHDFPSFPLDSIASWAPIVAANTPGEEPAGAPIFIAQGRVDPLVDPRVTAGFVRRLCGRGETVHYLVFDGYLHLSPDEQLTATMLAWLEDRFSGNPAPNDCRILLVSQPSN